MPCCRTAGSAARRCTTATSVASERDTRTYRRSWAAGFVRDMALARRAVTVVTDPSLAAFRAAELARPPFHGLRAAVEAIRELAAGYAPGPVLGDARQLGGALLVDTHGRVAYHHRS